MKPQQTDLVTRLCGQLGNFAIIMAYEGYASAITVGQKLL